ncbi:SGNH/GDSL hydrolase family protein [Methylocapsa palsarum]|uniref:GDSL-like Lipase/Acylhydrolase family protein n=1 Tax=Methylocapsa palsarum TaxID=1612308 RepID=A0A1I3YB27_9HYPH|nr:hypothetical protein [Methylocapsa palsarum]SFK29064.1 hypothetical protein SAMN05444581_105142 [Methylocapsa palsarum]
MTGRKTMLFRISAIAILLAVIAGLEAFHPFRGFRLLTFTAVFFLFAVLATLTRRGLRDGVIVAASIALALTLAEAGAAFSETSELNTVAEGFYTNHPILGVAPGHPGVYHHEKKDPKSKANVFKVDYTIDSNLLREVRAAKGGPAIVFFGDSFTFGLGVNDQDTLPQQFANLLNAGQSVLNIGFSGYSPAQFLREEETGLFDHVIGANPKLFIFQTAAFHAERTSCKASWTASAPRYTLLDDAVSFQGRCFAGPRLWTREWFENSAAYRAFASPIVNQINHNDVELYIRILKEAVRLAKTKYGAPTLIPYIRVADAYLARTGFTNEMVIDRLRETGGYVVDASLVQEASRGAVIEIQGDGHPTPLANRLRAALLKDYIEHNISGVLSESRIQSGANSLPATGP